MVAVVLSWPGVTPELYDETRERVGWEEDPAQGGVFRVARFVDGELRVLDVWESQADFERFAHERLLPVTSTLGLDVEPQIAYEPVHAIHNPAA